MNALRKLVLPLAALVWVTTWVVAAHPQAATGSEESPPAYSPTQQVSGTIRIWGHGGRGKDLDGPLVQSWEQSFRKYQPNVRFENQLRGNSSAIGGLYTGAADLAFMEREIWPTEIDAYDQVFGHKPSSVPAMTGSVDVPNHAFALVIFVHKDNPLQKLTLPQLDAIFGADHRRAPKNIRKWGELGILGEWADKPIHPYGYELKGSFSYFFEQAVLAGSEKWNCDLKEIADSPTLGKPIDAGQLILEQLAGDRYGIAISSLAYKNSATKPMALAGTSGKAYYPATRENVMRHSYPLTRTARIYFDRALGQPLDPKLKEFLSYIVSRQGQAEVLQHGKYLPLTSEGVQEAHRALQ